MPALIALAVSVGVLAVAATWFFFVAAVAPLICKSGRRS